MPPCSHEKIFVDFPLGWGYEIEARAIGIAAGAVEMIDKAEGGAVRHALSVVGDLDAAKVAAGVTWIGRRIACIKNIVGHGVSSGR